MTKEKTSITVMVNGEAKGAFPAPVDSIKEEVVIRSMNMKPVKDIMTSTSKYEVVFVPNKFINFVVT